MTWDDWSDLQVTVKICEVYGINFEIIQGVVICSVKHQGDNVISISGSVDYCNNPADTWPIIVDNNMWIQPDMVGDGFWHCYDCEEIATAKDKNPLRAAAIVFLMMKGVKPDERI